MNSATKISVATAIMAWVLSWRAYAWWMTPDELKVLRGLTETCEFLLRQHVWQTTHAKMVQLRFEKIAELLRDATAALAAPPSADSHALAVGAFRESDQLLAQLSEAGLSDALALVESDHEKIEMQIDQVRRKLAEWE